MIAPDILPVIIATLILLCCCPVLTAIFMYYRLGLRNRSTSQKIIISSLSILCILAIMIFLQRTFPFQAGIWFVLYCIVMGILTIAAYRKDKKAALTKTFTNNGDE